MSVSTDVTLDDGDIDDEQLQDSHADEDSVEVNSNHFLLFSPFLFLV
jgi:hypothetical protein